VKISSSGLGALLEGVQSSESALVSERLHTIAVSGESTVPSLPATCVSPTRITAPTTKLDI